MSIWPRSCACFLPHCSISHRHTLDKLSKGTIDWRTNFGILVEVDGSKRTLTYSLRGEFELLWVAG